MASGYQGLRSIHSEEFNFVARITQEIKRTVVELAADGFLDTIHYIQQALQQQMSLRRGLQTLHEGVAKAAQGATLSAYAESVEGQKRTEGSYRPPGGPARYSGGALRNALASPEMFQGGHDGIVIGNIETLNREARHWARLNFGASPAPTTTGEEFPVTIAKQRIMSIRFAPPQRSNAPMTMPRGIWGDSEIGQRLGFPSEGFYPSSPISSLSSITSNGIKKPTRGIQARRFFDEGVKVVSEQLAPAYSNWLRGQMRLTQSGKGPFKNRYRVI